MPARPTVSTLAREHALQLLEPGRGKKRPSRGAAPQEKEDLLEGKLSYGQSGRFGPARAAVTMKGEIYVNKICRSTSLNRPASFASRSCASSCLLLLLLLSPAFFYCIWSCAYKSIMLSPVLFGCGTQRRLICRTCTSAPKFPPRGALMS